MTLEDLEVVLSNGLKVGSKAHWWSLKCRYCSSSICGTPWYVFLVARLAKKASERGVSLAYVTFYPRTKIMQ